MPSADGDVPDFGAARGAVGALDVEDDDVFAGFFRKNRKWFDATMKENILQTAVEISIAFRGENKEEHAFMENLKKLLYKKPDVHFL